VEQGKRGIHNNTWASTGAVLMKSALVFAESRIFDENGQLKPIQSLPREVLVRSFREVREPRISCRWFRETGHEVKLWDSSKLWNSPPSPWVLAEP